MLILLTSTNLNKRLSVHLLTQSMKKSVMITAMKHPRIIEVAVPTPLLGCFDYLAIDHQTATIGCRVLVPFGRRKLVGIVMGAKTHSSLTDKQLKSILKIIDDTPLLNESIIKLSKWASGYYHHSIGEILTLGLAKTLRQGKSCEAITPTLLKLSTNGLAIDPASITRAKKQRQLLEILRKSPDGLSINTLQEQGISGSVIRSVKQLGWLETIASELSMETNPSPEQPLLLNTQQQNALTVINQASNTFSAIVLDGVTGSGKTEVYLQAIDQQLKQGRQALVIVPEIALTPQTVGRFKRRFKANIGVWHSKLSDTQRHNTFVAAHNDQIQIMIGTRSAIFSPLNKLGIIIIDEEHDGSLKQQTGFRYHARDLAIVRAQQTGIPIVLGSATPSLKTLFNIEQGHYQRLKLEHRIADRQLPTIKCVDLRSQQSEEGISAPLMKAIDQHLQAGDQVLLFLNRRGFAPVLLCHDCGWNAICTRCDSNLTLHQSNHQLRCHHCDQRQPIPSHCPSCNQRSLVRVGQGTQRIAEVLSERFPDYPLLRIDADTTSKKNSFEIMLDQILSGKAKILIGTQMLAKGHHFPNVTLVGMLDVDSRLFSPDFRATEQFAQLFTQVSGRAGRGEKPGTVIIQTHQPEHPLLKCLIHENYHQAAKLILNERQQAALPPYRHFALIRAESIHSQQPFDFLSTINQQVSTCTNNVGIQILGPIPALMPRRNGRTRAQLLISATAKGSLQKLLPQVYSAIRGQKAIARYSIDVDPLDMY